MKSGPGSRGSRVSMTSALSTRPCTSRAAGPHSVAIASSRLPSVADRPQTTSLGFQRFSRASASCTCTPRLLPISSCHSSTITVCTPASSRDACSRVSSSDSDSGVVTSTVGSRLSCRARSALAVSPVRCPTVHAGAMSGSGSRDRAGGVGGERPHRREPQDAQWRRASPGQRQPQRGGTLQRAEPHRIGLAAAGGGVQQATLASGHRGPDLALECKRGPATRCKPCRRVRHRHVVRRCGVGSGRHGSVSLLKGRRILRCAAMATALLAGGGAATVR